MSLIHLAVTENIVPTRNLNLLYIILDSIFLIVFLSLLIWKKRYETILFAVFGGILYTIVDFGGFYLMSHTRTVYINGEVANALDTFLVLFWMSMSYGITNFAFIWTALSKDKYTKYWIFLICMWWMIAPSIADMGGEATIQTTRTTGAYHGWMGIVLVISYLILIVIQLNKENSFVNILYLCLIGFSGQFGWEFALLVNGIRPMNEASIKTLLVNSCLETNLGMPAIYSIFWFVRSKFNEDLTKANKINNQ